MFDQPKKQRKRKPKEVYIDGIGLHQWSLPLEMAGGGMARISLGDNNHAVLVTDQEIRVSTKILTVLAMTLQGAFGKEGRIHSLAVFDRDLGDGIFVGLRIASDPRADTIQLLFTRINPAAAERSAATPRIS
jgi:hypothetical protein